MKTNRIKWKRSMMYSCLSNTQKTIGENQNAFKQEYNSEQVQQSNINDTQEHGGVEKPCQSAQDDFQDDDIIDEKCYTAPEYTTTEYTTTEYTTTDCMQNSEILKESVYVHLNEVQDNKIPVEISHINTVHLSLKEGTLEARQKNRKRYGYFSY